MKRLILLIAVISSLFVLPGIASAGCLAQAATTSYTTNPEPGMIGNAAIDCTYPNGTSYQRRIYSQGNSGGWHITTSAFTTNYSNPAPNFHSEIAIVFRCAVYVPADTQARLKVVVENMVTHSIDIAYGIAGNIPSSCY